MKGRVVYHNITCDPGTVNWISSTIFCWWSTTYSDGSPRAVSLPSFFRKISVVDNQQLTCVFISKDFCISSRKQLCINMNDLTKDQQRAKRWRQHNPQWIKNYREKNKERIKKRSREYYLKNKEKVNAVRKVWYLANKTRIIQKLRDRKATWSGRISEWKKGAKCRKISWELTTDFIQSLPLVCHYTGEPLVMEVGHPNTISIDRLDSNKPYSADNVVLCGAIVNQMKSYFDKNVFIERCRKITKYHEQSNHQH